MKNQPEAIFPKYKDDKLVAIVKYDMDSRSPKVYKVQEVSTEELAELVTA